MRADAAYGRFPDDTALVPSLFWFEMRNLCLVNERRGRIDDAITTRGLALLRRLPITVDRDGDESMLLLLARRHKLTAYDAAYLELGLRKNVPLATLDDALMRAARAENMAIIGDNA